MSPSDDEMAVLLAALKGGVGLERSGYEFYMKAAAEIEDDFLSKTLEFLAHEEQKHERFLEGVIDSLKVDGELPDRLGLESGIHGKLPKIFPEMGEYAAKVKAAAPGRKDPRLAKICEEALAVEDKSIGFYEASRERAPSPKSSRIFELLIGEERKHKQLIEMQRDYSGVHGYFFDIGLERHFALEG